MRHLIVSSVLFVSLAGCAGGPQPMSIATPGQDTAYLNKNRGNSSALLSSEQASQYYRQQQMAANEIELGKMKRKENTETVKDKISIFDSILNTTNRAIGVFDRL